MSERDSQTGILFLDYSRLNLGHTEDVPKRAGMTICLDEEHRNYVTGKLGELGKVLFHEQDGTFGPEHYPLVLQLERKPTGGIYVHEFPYEQFKERMAQLAAVFKSKGKKEGN